MNFIAVRVSTAYLHPRVLGSTSNLPGPMRLTFLVSIVAMALLLRDAVQVRAHREAHARAAARAAPRLVGDEAEASATRRRSAAPAIQTAGTIGPRPAGRGASMAAITAELPALPLHTAGKYVAAAYVVLFALVLIYVAIMSVRLSRIERELGELLEIAERPAQPAAGADAAQQAESAPA